MGKGLWLKILPLWSTFCKLRSLETGEHLYFACEIPSSLCWSFCCCVPVLPFHPVHLSNCDKAEGNELDQNEQVCTGSCSVHIKPAHTGWLPHVCCLLLCFSESSFDRVPLLPWKFGLCYRIQIRDCKASPVLSSCFHLDCFNPAEWNLSEEEIPEAVVSSSRYNLCIWERKEPHPLKSEIWGWALVDKTTLSQSGKQTLNICSWQLPSAVFLACRFCARWRGNKRGICCLCSKCRRRYFGQSWNPTFYHIPQVNTFYFWGSHKSGTKDSRITGSCFSFSAPGAWCQQQQC